MIFQKPPADFVKNMDVVACYVQYNEQIVLLQRQPQKSSAKQYGLPAGKVNSGEDILQAMTREIHEETGLVIPKEDLHYIDTVFVRHDGRDIAYHMFVTELTEQSEIHINPDEHQSYVWVSPGEAITLDLVHDLAECIRTYYGV